MKTFAGDRTIDGIVVTLNGAPLDAHTEMHRYTDGGFEWGYEGPAPSQLAYAMLVEHLGDPRRAEALQDRFMRAVTANFENEWVMTSADIDQALTALN